MFANQNWCSFHLQKIPDNKSLYVLHNMLKFNMKLNRTSSVLRHEELNKNGPMSSSLILCCVFILFAMFAFRKWEDVTQSYGRKNWWNRKSFYKHLHLNRLKEMFAYDFQLDFQATRINIDSIVPGFSSLFSLFFFSIWSRMPLSVGDSTFSLSLYLSVPTHQVLLMFTWNFDKFSKTFELVFGSDVA